MLHKTQADSILSFTVIEGQWLIVPIIGHDLWWAGLKVKDIFFCVLKIIKLCIKKSHILLFIFKRYKLALCLYKRRFHSLDKPQFSLFPFLRSVTARAELNPCTWVVIFSVLSLLLFFVVFSLESSYQVIIQCNQFLGPCY